MSIFYCLIDTFSTNVDGFDMIAICVEKINLFRHVLAGEGNKTPDETGVYC